MTYRKFILTRTADGYNVREAASLFRCRASFPETYRTGYDAVRAIERMAEERGFVPIIKGV